ncbi:hypothetical protein [Deinococcus knuensis]|uniref:Uncharacterized protein n=1 Tax=Deinococcus knuensis TaxID=1837380 RepID=A0ABQ2SG93_9DEIO|nr:hypothetical protein [Deinococcus knuensis]GGS28008.1 hypothetical protein GCM10008961_19540 [Deinococcus knuensis]
MFVRAVGTECPYLPWGEGIGVDGVVTLQFWRGDELLDAQREEAAFDIADLL